MFDRTEALCELDRLFFGPEQIVFFHFLSEQVKLLQGLWNFQACYRTLQQCRDVRGLAMFTLPCTFADIIIGSGTLSLGARNQQIIADDGECGGIPFTRNEPESALWRCGVRSCLRNIEHRDGIECSIRHKEVLTIRRLRQSIRDGPRIFLAWHCRIE